MRRGDFGFPTYTEVVSGEVQGSATAAQLPNIPCKAVMFRAMANNAGNVYLGFSSGVTKPDGTTDATTGFQMQAGVNSGWMPISNLNLLWLICDNAGDDLTYIAIR